MSNATPDGPVERYLSDPYGRVMVLKEDWTPQQVAGHDHGTVSAFGNEILFTGYRWNPAPAPGMGTYHARFRGREYHPLLGRFMQRDPMGYVDGRNLYEYAGNNPVRFNDPSGFTINCFWKLYRYSARCTP